jgi:hypothetical protein
VQEVQEAQEETGARVETQRQEQTLVALVVRQ